MRRRDFINLIGTAPFALGARGADRRAYRLGVVAQPERSRYDTLFAELRRNGFVEGSNLLVDPQGFGIPPDRLMAVASEVAKTAPDVIFCGGDAASLAAQRATTTVPIVVLTDDIVRTGLIKSFAHPGGNITGVSIFAPELDRKRFEILIEMLPGLQKAGVLADPATTEAGHVKSLQEFAGTRRIELSVYYAATAERIEHAINAARAFGVTALSVLSSALFNAQRRTIINVVAAAHLPAIHQWPEFVGQGALIAYGPRLEALYIQVAHMLVKVLQGGKPAEIPAQQPTVFELLINLKAANALNLTIPPTLLARADEVIE
jgi:putative tryptophan/tyrosine transport system substrate-binding protein